MRKAKSPIRLRGRWAHMQSCVRVDIVTSRKKASADYILVDKLI